MLQHNKVSVNCGKKEPDNEVLIWATTASETSLQSTEPGLGPNFTRDVKSIICNITTSIQLCCNVSQININMIFFYLINPWPLTHIQITFSCISLWSCI